MRLRSKITVVALFLIFALALSIIIWPTREPACDGKTVTEWLDTIYVIDRRTNGTTMSGTIYRSAADLHNQPGYHALLKMGRTAVPVLMQRVSDPPAEQRDVAFFARWKQRLISKWHDWTAGKSGARSKAVLYSFGQERRKTTAALMLVALGHKSDGGFVRFLEANAAAPNTLQLPSNRATGVSGGDVARAVKAALPEQWNELLADIGTGLQHSNNLYRWAAANAARALPDERGRWRPILEKLIDDPDEPTQREALWTLYSSDGRYSGNADLHRKLEAIVNDASKSKATRDAARAVLRTWDRPNVLRGR
jgi:hypothetical protein